MSRQNSYLQHQETETEKDTCHHCYFQRGKNRHLWLGEDGHKLQEEGRKVESPPGGQREGKSLTSGREGMEKRAGHHRDQHKAARHWTCPPIHQLFRVHQHCTQLRCALIVHPTWEVFEQRVYKCSGEEETWFSVGQRKGGISLNSVSEDQA